MSPLVSVVMPAFNAASTVSAAIDSVRFQGIDELELIVVDDGSTDATPAVLDALSMPRLQVLRQTNAGASAARNRGIAAARGRYLAFLDADDVWLAGKLQAQIEALAGQPGAQVAYGWVNFVDDDGRFVHRDRRPALDGDIYAALLQQNFIASGSNILVTRAALDHVGGFDESLRGVEDWELNTRLAARFEFVHVPRVVTHYRKTDDSLSSDVALMEQAFLVARAKVFDAAPPQHRHLAGVCTASFYHYLAMRFMQTGGWRRAPTKALRLLKTSWSAAPGGNRRVLKALNPLGPLRYAARRRRPRTHT